jgi:hypothetical protein
LAVPVTLLDNRVIADNAPFYSIGTEDNLGELNYALNHPDFIDIPYALFDFGSTTSVTSATLNWDFGSLYGSSSPTEISLYVGSDSDGLITTADRNMGALADTFVFSGGETFDFDITSLVNSALLSGQYVAARFEVTAAPGSLTSYHGGNFLVPSMIFETSSVPEPASIVLLGLGLAGIGFSRKKKSV